ncbi:hypothetical protein [Nostoc punctiforme]|uniref:Uncharacterized protein n=1 Tax=Nostoc punctiforme NIES-2108 TaxID=1356359 RepID=A0A367QYC4_NOSPU|nr:hypothetical protein [Nostoc punctiforme]RCJ29197.1 hypothetical protein A6769_35980 [Nostoc punctiforme NIES-2108]
MQTTKLQRFLLGVDLIRRYEVDAEIGVNHGFINIGSYEICYSKMPDHECALMKQWGWVEGNGGWSFYTVD